MAEFLIDLHDSSKTLDEFRAKLKESGSDFPESFITSMDRLVLSMHPKYKKKKAATNGAEKGKGKVVDGPVESAEVIKQRKLFPGLAIQDSEWQPSYAPDSEAGKIKGVPEVEDFLDDMMSQLEGAEKRIKGNGSDLKRKRSISPPVVRGRRQSPDYNGRRNDEERGRGGRARQPLDTQPVMYKIYPGKVTGIKDFGAFVSLEGIQGRHEGMVHISSIQSNARVNHPSDLLSRGQSVLVKVMSIAAGRIGLSMKDVDQDSGRDLTPHLRIKSEAEMAEETASRFSSGSNSGPLGGRSGYGNAAPVKFADDHRSSAKRLTSPERWEIKQLIASGAASASDYPNLDEDFATPNATEADEELDIEVKEDEAPFLAGQARRALDMSPVKIIKSLDGSLNRAAMAGQSLAKERREMRQQELNDQADSEDKNLGTAWQDPMAAPMERQFAADLRGQQMSRKKADDSQPTWRGDKNQPVTFGKITNQTMAEQRASLPIYQYRQQLVEAIRDVSILIFILNYMLKLVTEPSHGRSRRDWLRQDNANDAVPCGRRFRRPWSNRMYSTSSCGSHVRRKACG